MIIDGKKIASEILAEVKKEVEVSTHDFVVRAIVVAPSPATISYLKIKTDRAHEAGMELVVVRLQDEATTEDVIAEIQKGGADAIIVQLPLPSHISQDEVVNAIPVFQDADVLSDFAYNSFAMGVATASTPPVAEAVLEILHRTQTSVEGKNIVIVGEGKLVGKPVRVALLQKGALVTVVTRENEGELSNLCKKADIIISGAGSPHLITADMVQEGVVLIDAGTSESNGAIAGDVDPACEDKASVFTPVPGGVGPIAVACLFRNVLQLVRANHNLAS